MPSVYKKQQQIVLMNVSALLLQIHKTGKRKKETRFFEGSWKTIQRKWLGFNSRFTEKQRMIRETTWKFESAFRMFFISFRRPPIALLLLFYWETKHEYRNNMEILISLWNILHFIPPISTLATLCCCFWDWPWGLGRAFWSGSSSSGPDTVVWIYKSSAE